MPPPGAVQPQLVAPSLKMEHPSRATDHLWNEGSFAPHVQAGGAVLAGVATCFVRPLGLELDAWAGGVGCDDRYGRRSTVRSSRLRRRLCPGWASFLLRWSDRRFTRLVGA